jgi:hypothetical protein
LALLQRGPVSSATEVARGLARGAGGNPYAVAVIDLDEDDDPPPF